MPRYNEKTKGCSRADFEKAMGSTRILGSYPFYLGEEETLDAIQDAIIARGHSIPIVALAVFSIKHEEGKPVDEGFHVLKRDCNYSREKARWLAPGEGETVAGIIREIGGGLFSYFESDRETDIEYTFGGIVKGVAWKSPGDGGEDHERK